MVNTSNLYREKICTSGRKFHAKVKIEFTDQTILELSDEDIMQNGITIEDCVSPSNSFEVGSAIINELTLELYNLDEKFNNYDFENAVINVQIGLEIGENLIEWIPKGYFTVNEANFSSSTITITALDNMYKFDKPYTKSGLTYPATLFTILQDACNQCGVILNTQIFLNSDYVVQNRPSDEKITFREIVAWIAQLSGNFARINYNGTLDLSWYDYTKFSGDTPQFATINRLKSYEIGANDIKITGVQISPIDEESSPYLSGEDGYVLAIKDNPLAQNDIENLTSSLGEKLNNFTFRPFETSALSDPSIEAGDVCKITDKNGNIHESFISYISFTFGSFETFRADAETPNKKESTRYSASSKAIQVAKKEVQKQLSNYDLSVNQMNNLVINAIGLFETTEIQDDGSKIYYAHDKPILAESQIIWKSTRDAFAVSYDGGQTWYGMSAEGNMLAQVLNVIGVNANWINTGNLKVGFSQSQSGAIELYDNSNTLICLIDKDGITIYCKDGRKVRLNAEVGFAGYDIDNSKMYWVSEDDFHMRDSVIENQLTIAQRLRFIPIQTDTNYGIGIVAMI